MALYIHLKKLLCFNSASTIWKALQKGLYLEKEDRLEHSS